MEEKNVDFKDIVDIYEIANDLLISLETTSPQGEAVLTYQMRYALDHVIDALKLSQKSDVEKETIIGELKRARGHLIRVIFDAAEIVVLRGLKTMHKGVRFVTPKVITEVYPQFHTDYEKLYRFRDKLNGYKKVKSNDTNISVLSDLKDIVEETNKITAEFELKKKLMKNATIRYIVWAGLGVILTAGVTFVVTYFASR